MMNRSRLRYRSGNPALNKSSFDSFSRTSRGAEINEVMTIKGTVDKTAIGLFLLIFSGYYSFAPGMTYLIPVGVFGGLIVAIITIFKKEWSPITVPIYAILEGLAMGSISYMFNQAYEGIVMQAIGLTLGILASLLLAYRSGMIKATENFKLGVVAATGGIFLVYMASFVMSFFGASISVLDPTNSSLMSIGISLFIVVIASLNLVLDFDFIEEGAEKGAPKYMEWYGAFGLLVTLIWLYLEILKLLSKLRSR
ncbi:MAG: Bax inhibitor-1/YccA family protein [Flavobacteriaceae bacterium]|nr:Bax inhibitor-1/YccA family protein [Flavobacteriaceae bacterium]